MTDKPDLDHLRQWIGRSTQASDIVTAQLTKGLRATLFLPIGEPKPGVAAPFTVHWCLAQPVFPMSELGPDGHPARGGFLPPVPLPRRLRFLSEKSGTMAPCPRSAKPPARQKTGPSRHD